MDRIKSLWLTYGKWLLFGLPVLVVAVCLAASAATSDNAPRTMAEAPAETEITFDMEANRAYTASDGVIVIPASDSPISVAPTAAKSAVPAFYVSGDAVSEADTARSAPAPAPAKVGGNYTMPEDAQMADGSVGLLTIPKLSLAVNVYESENEMEAMTHGVAHFKTTSAWSGNIGLCSHNVNFDLTDGYFKNIHTLKAGDTISYQTALGSRSYTVETVAEIAESDWSYLGRTEDNRVTLITCISGKPRSRLVVQAMAI